MVGSREEGHTISEAEGAVGLIGTSSVMDSWVRSLST
jgi:hypothetical protein